MESFSVKARRVSEPDVVGDTKRTRTSRRDTESHSRSGESSYEPSGLEKSKREIPANKNVALPATLAGSSHQILVGSITSASASASDAVHTHLLPMAGEENNTGQEQASSIQDDTAGSRRHPMPLSDLRKILRAKRETAKAQRPVAIDRLIPHAAVNIHALSRGSPNVA
jgi:hypothetical protein